MLLHNWFDEIQDTHLLPGLSAIFFLIECNLPVCP